MNACRAGIFAVQAGFPVRQSGLSPAHAPAGMGGNCLACAESPEKAPEWWYFVPMLVFCYGRNARKPPGVNSVHMKDLKLSLFQDSMNLHDA